MEPQINIKNKIETEMISNWSQLKGIIVKLVKNPTIADDILQTSFIKAVSTKSPPNNQKKILPWLKTVVKNTSLDILRKQNNEQKNIINSDSIEIESPTTIDSDICTCILSLLKSLSVNDQDILKTLDMESTPIKTLSQSTSTPINTLKVRRHRARQRLKKRLINVCNVGTAAECKTCECN
ncbi:sigma-70 family RNA polymerase sigma factor [bacterium]|nr:sigma-70 family RNA polymerase sigma factor [bacterium]